MLAEHGNCDDVMSVVISNIPFKYPATKYMKRKLRDSETFSTLSAVRIKIYISDFFKGAKSFIIYTLATRIKVDG